MSNTPIPKETMSREELMKPRYKVIADYPQSEFKVGEVIQFDRYGALPMQMKENPDESWLTDFIERPTGSVMYSENAFSPYPHLFRRLEWWEERNVKDMPDMYVKEEGGKIHKVSFIEEYSFLWMKSLSGEIISTWAVNDKVMCFFTPATKEEYDNQNSKL